MNQSTPPVPTGYRSWVEFAVETFDTGRLAADYLFDDDNPYADRNAIREAARSELRAFMAAAATDGAAKPR